MVTEQEWTDEMVRTNRLHLVSVAVGLMTFALKPITSGLLMLSTRQQQETDEEVRDHNEELMHTYNEQLMSDSEQLMRVRDELHDAVDDLATLTKLVGARIGLLRAMAETQLEVPTDTISPETQLEVPTDTLTDLLGPRSFSEQVAAVPVRLHPVAVAMADLDHFQAFNERHGHETGDRALRLFARVLRDSLRNSDIISRYDGDVFAIAFPSCSAKDAARALDLVRTQFDAAIIVGGLPTFTVSFGVTEGEPGEELPAVLRRADDALLLAKRLGRDRVVLHEPGVAMNGAAGEEHVAKVDEDAPRLLEELRTDRM